MPTESTEPKPTISTYLKSLGDTTTQVYLTLYRQGIRGRRCSPTCCPVMNAIKTFCDLPWGMPTLKGYYLAYNDPQIMDISIPRPVMDLMTSFDGGDWPLLDQQLMERVVDGKGDP